MDQISESVIGSHKENFYSDSIVEYASALDNRGPKAYGDDNGLYAPDSNFNPYQHYQDRVPSSNATPGCLMEEDIEKDSPN